MNNINVKYSISILTSLIILMIVFIMIPESVILKTKIFKFGGFFSLLVGFLSYFVKTGEVEFKKLLKIVIYFLIFTLSYMFYFVFASLITFYIPGEETTYETNITNPTQRKTTKSSLPCPYNGYVQSKNKEDWFTMCIDESQFKEIKSNKKITIVVTTKENLFGYTIISTKIVN